MLLWRWHRQRLLASPKRLGRWGEARAEKHLRKKGLTLLCRNFRCSSGELDLVFLDNEGCIVFVEVKTRANEDFSPVETAVTWNKRRRMTKAARLFLAKNNFRDRPCRFDFVGIVAAVERPDIRHYPNAFEPVSRSRR